MDTGRLASLSACGRSTVACSIILCTYLATDELLSHELLGSLGAAHPQQDRSLPRLEDHLEAEEGAALPLGGHKPHQLLGPLRPSREHELVAIVEFIGSLTTGEELARELLPALPLLQIAQAAGYRQLPHGTFCFGTHVRPPLLVDGCSCLPICERNT